MASRGARKAAQNKITKARHAESRKQQWDDRRSGEKVGYGDIAASAAGALPYLGMLGGAGKAAKAVKGAGKAYTSKATAAAKGGASEALSGNITDAASGAAGGVGKGYVKGKAKDLVKKGLKTGMKGLGIAGDVAGAAAKGIGIIGAAKAAYDTGKLINKMQAQNMTDEEYQNFRTTGSTTGSRRGKNSRGRRSPVNNNGWEVVESPFKRTSPFKNYRFTQPGQNVPVQNYVTMSQRIGDSVGQAVDEHREREDRERAEIDRQMEMERKAQMKEMQDMQLATLKANQYETLQVAADTSIPSADSYLQNASRMLVDQQAELTAQLKKGEIDMDTYAQKTAHIKGQVPQLQATKEALTGFQDSYQTLLESNELSQANDGQAGQLYSAITSGDMNIGPDPETGEIMITGAQGALSMPLSQVGRLPKPVKKAQPLNMMMKPLAEGLADSPTWTADAETQVRQQLDNLISSPDDNINNAQLKAIAVDDLGLSLEKANELLDTKLDDDEYGNTNALEKYVEEQMIQETQQQYQAAQTQRRINQANARLKEAQAAAYERQLTNPGAAQKMTVDQQKQQRINNIAQGFQNTYNQLSKMDMNDPENAGAIQNLLSNFTGGEIEDIVFEPGGDVSTSSWYNPLSWGDSEKVEPTFYMYRKGSKEAIPVTYDALLRNIGLTQFGNNSPFNKNDDSKRNRKKIQEREARAEEKYGKDYYLDPNMRDYKRQKSLLELEAPEDDIYAQQAKQAYSNWELDPETQRRWAESETGVDPNRINQAVHRAQMTPMTVDDEKVPSQGLYNPYKDRAYVNSQAGLNTGVHELTHAGGLDAPRGAHALDIIGTGLNVKDGMGNIVEGASDYVRNPQEVGAFMMQARQKLGLKPGQKVTEEMLQSLYQGGDEAGNMLIRAAGDSGKMKELTKAFNTVAMQDSPKRDMSGYA